jgi:hypothetical protein
MSSEAPWWRAEVVTALAAIIASTALYLLAARGGLPAPAGLVGHGLGILGGLLMLVAQTAYTWRKRPERNGPGPTRLWLQIHVVAGLVGPYLVLLHTAFRFRGLAGVFTLLMLVVVLSGCVGRYAYAATPVAGPDEKPRPLAIWYLLHVPVTAALFVLALIHVAGALYYTRLLR